ncbi:MAG: hypothetical protein IKD47_03520 [Clostridia bacterium]|nr:hypothetical protein [Clostridia bacterium]
MNFLKNVRILSGNALKIIAAICMVIDHVGFIFFPQMMWLRIIGRIAMPIFAFTLAEGCRYTKNKVKHFCLLFGLGAICQVVYYVFAKDTYLNILLTFSLATLVLYAMRHFKKCLFDENTPSTETVFFGLVFIATIFGTYLICQNFTVDYGFWGCMLPAFAGIFDFHRIPAPAELKKIDILPVRVCSFAVGIWAFCAFTVTPMPTAYMFLALPFLFLYNGEKGKWNMKYFFYLFYPLHLAALQGLSMIL